MLFFFFFLKHQKAPQSLGKQKWGNYVRYIQILQYIPFKPAGLSTGKIPQWREFALVLLLYFETKWIIRKNGIPGYPNSWLLDQRYSVVHGHVDLTRQRTRPGWYGLKVRMPQSHVSQRLPTSFPHFGSACCGPNVNSNCCIGCGIQGGVIVVGHMFRGTLSERHQDLAGCGKILGTNRAQDYGPVSVKSWMDHLE